MEIYPESGAGFGRRNRRASQKRTNHSITDLTFTASHLSQARAIHCTRPGHAQSTQNDETSRDPQTAEQQAAHQSHISIYRAHRMRVRGNAARGIIKLHTTPAYACDHARHPLHTHTLRAMILRLLTRADGAPKEPKQRAEATRRGRGDGYFSS